MNNLNSNVNNNKRNASRKNNRSLSSGKLIDFKENKKYLKLLAILFGVIVLIFIIVMIYITIKTRPTRNVQDYMEEVLWKHIHDCKNNPLVIGAKNIPASTFANEYAISFWLYVSSLDATHSDHGSTREVLTRGIFNDGRIQESNLADQNSLRISLPKDKNKLDINFSMDEKLSDIGCVSINNLIGEHIKAFFNGAATITDEKYQPTQGNNPSSSIKIPTDYPNLIDNKINFVLHKHFKLDIDLTCKITLPPSTGNIDNGNSKNIIDIYRHDGNRSTIATRFLDVYYYYFDSFGNRGAADKSKLRLRIHDNNGSFGSTNEEFTYFEITEVIDSSNEKTFKISIEYDYKNKKFIVTCNDEKTFTEGKTVSHNIETADFLYTQFQNDKLYTPCHIHLDGSLRGDVTTHYINVTKFEYTDLTLDSEKLKPLVPPTNHITEEECLKKYTEDNDYIAMFDTKQVTGLDTFKTQCFGISNKNDATYKLFSEYCASNECKSNEDKCISRGTDKKGPQNMGSEDHIFIRDLKSSNRLDKECAFENFPLQRWCMITLNIHQNVCDFFFDGRLYRTCVLDGNIKVLPNHAIIIGNNGGFDGFVSNVIYANKALHPSRINEKYLRGPRFQLSLWERIKYMFMPARKDIQKQIEAEADKKEEEILNEGRM